MILIYMTIRDAPVSKSANYRLISRLTIYTVYQCIRALGIGLAYTGGLVLCVPGNSICFLCTCCMLNLIYLPMFFLLLHTCLSIIMKNKNDQSSKPTFMAEKPIDKPTD